MKNIVISSILAAILCGTISAGEADFTNKKSEFDFDSINFNTRPPTSVVRELVFLKDSKKIMVGNLNEKTFTLDKITNQDEKISYVAGASKDASIDGYTLNINLKTLNGNPQNSTNIAHLIGGLSIDGSSVKNKINFTKIPEDPKRDVNLYGGISIRSDANLNSLKITSNGSNSDVYGGLSLDGKASSNEVTITSSKNLDRVIGGRSEYNGEANYNKVTIDSKSFVKSVVYGGVISRGKEASNNEVYINNSEIRKANPTTYVAGTVIGGKVDGEKGDANLNKVVIKASSIGGEVSGAEVYNKDGSSNHNEVTIKDSSKIKEDVYGGTSRIGKEANSNKVTINSSTVGGNAVGGRTDENGQANNNIVTITSSSTINQQVMGGWANEDANLNEISIDKSTVNDSVIGGFSKNSVANSNSVTIKNESKINDSVFGAYAKKGDANKNIINSTSSNVGENIYGGYATKANANENKILLNKTQAKKVVGGQGGKDTNLNKILVDNSQINNFIIGGWSTGSGTANKNKIFIKNSKKTNFVYGGFANGSVSENEVSINNSTIEKLAFGGQSNMGDTNKNNLDLTSSSVGNIYGGYAKKGNTNDNKVSIDDSTIKELVYGGLSNKGNANNNKVSLKSSRVGSSVAGGSAKHEANKNIIDITSSNIGGDVFGGSSSEGDAINNTINLFHNSGRDITLGKHFLVKGVIYGGLSGDKSKEEISGNTLNVTGKDLIAGNIKNFNEVNFNLPKDIKTNDIALQLTNNVDTALRNVTVNTYVEKGKSKAIVKNLKPGEKIYVIKKASINDDTLKEKQAIDKKLTIKSKKLSNKTISEVGASTVYDVELNEDKSNLFLEVSKNATPKTNPKLNHTLIPNLASSHVVNQMSDLVSDNIPNIAILDNNISANTDNIISFGYVKGYKSNIGKNDTDVNGAIVDVGVASRADNALMGGFFEYSYADYDGSINSYKNDGKIKAYAVGALARFDLRNNFFIDSYAKIGKLNNKYTLKGYDNLNINKDSTFYSLGAFLGHDSYFDRFMLTNRLGYAYSKVDGYELDIDGETLNVKDISSKRIKFDSIAYYKTNTDTNLYARARFIYELDGKSGIYAPNMNKDIESTTKGFSGGGELGVIYSIKPLSNISFGVGAMGGKIDELSANLRFVYGW